MSRQKKLPVIPLKDVVVFPGSITPLFIVRHKSLLALESAVKENKRVFLIAQCNSDTEHPGIDELYEVGTLAEIIQILRLPDGSAKILVEGTRTSRAVEFDMTQEYLRARLEVHEDIQDNNRRTEALHRTIVHQFERYAQLSEKIPEDLALSIKSLEDSLQLANAVANYCYFSTQDKQRVLQTRRVSEKLIMISELLASENELLELENKIITQVKGKIGRSQKEYFLSEQLKVIEKELGIGSEEDMELEEFEERIQNSKLSEEAREKAMRELSRLSKMAQLSPEATVSRTYIEWLLELPWGKYTRDRSDLARAQKILDEDHYGLEKIKERIVEHLAVLRLVKEIRGPILCLVGPPGVGKTSLARSIARTLNRKFVRISLGGVRDEAEIRGHRRTYIGSMPGKIIQSMKKAGSMNPVFLLDEVDKMNNDFRGDPASALLEVLDPEQNKTFTDHYLDIDFDLSRVMFITTANTVDGIPPALLDRMELIRLPGYTEDEKRHIAGSFLIPKQVKAHGLEKKRVVFTEQATDHIIQRYTREAGVRNLEREIATLCRKLAWQLIENRRKSTRITPRFVRRHLGPERHHEIGPHKKSEIGVATGLAWTEAGGEILSTETTTMRGKGELQLTGSLGEVMRESARAALSFLRAHAKRYELADDFHKELDIHVHIPEGAIPKDGPSAGVTIICSMLSALTGQPVRQDLAMTGEITLRGKVLKIGGLKEKVVAAHRNHLWTVLIPRDNLAEIEEIRPEIRDDLTFVPIASVTELIEWALPGRKLSSDTRKGSLGKARKKAPRQRGGRGLGTRV
mgnify:CR=1 FL=1